MKSCYFKWACYCLNRQTNEERRHASVAPENPSNGSPWSWVSEGQQEHEADAETRWSDKGL